RGAAIERHADVPDGETATALAQQRLDAGGGVETEGRAAGQHHGVDALDGAVRLEQVALPRGRGAAAHVHGDGGGLGEDDGGDARGGGRLVGPFDPDAGGGGGERARRH